MKYSYNWLKELSGTKKSVEEVAELFLTHSFEVEGIEDLSKGLDKVVVGEVLEMKKHPDADRLNIAKVKVSTTSQSQNNADLTQTDAENVRNDVKSDEILQIVCGAPNLEVGQKVPVALVGAKLPLPAGNGKSKVESSEQEEFFEIKQSKIRGVESFGMICAEDELGLGDDHEGILVLGSDAKIGQSLAEYLYLDDKILDIDILPNRGHDCLGYWGVAKELQALENSILKTKTLKLKFRNSVDGDLEVKVKTENCSRYAGARIKNIKIQPSPVWMQTRLKVSGIKPINNVVDITNYVMLETGQPLHAFDSQKLEAEGQKCTIVVRQAEEGEKIILLDGRELELVKDDIVITDGKRPVVLAGVMGGLDSGVQNNTTEIILEVANFNSSSIRFTARRYNLQTDAAYRFERDIDPNFVDMAISRAVELLKEFAGGEVVEIKDVYPEPVNPWIVNLNTDYVRRLLGVDISDEEIKNILERLRLEVKNQNLKIKSHRLRTKDKELRVRNSLVCTIPTVRRDLRTPEDLIEEVGRIYGYDKIKPKPLQASVQTPHRNEQRYFERQLKNIATTSGFSEIRSYSFHSEKDAEILGLKNLKHVELLNPGSPEQAMLRNTLAIGILKAGRKSLSYFKEVRIFEIGKVYLNVNDSLPQEVLVFSGGVFSREKDGTQFYETKGLIDVILESFGLNDCYYDDKVSDGEKPKGMPSLHPSRQALLKTASGKVLGWLGEIDKKATKYFGLKNVRGAIFGIDVDKLREEIDREISFRSLPKFPFVERDLSIIVGEKLKAGEVENFIYKVGGKLLQEVNLFDLYQNKETGERSMAFHLVFGDTQKTLQADEVDIEVNRIIGRMEDELGVKVKR